MPNDSGFPVGPDGAQSEVETELPLDQFYFPSPPPPDWCPQTWTSNKWCLAVLLFQWTTFQSQMQTNVNSKNLNETKNIQFCSHSFMTASVHELTHCECNHHRIKGDGDRDRILLELCIMDSDISPCCFLYKIQKDSFRKPPAVLQSTFHHWTLRRFLNSVFIFLGTRIHSH